MVIVNPLRMTISNIDTPNVGNYRATDIFDVVAVPGVAHQYLVLTGPARYVCKIIIDENNPSRVATCNDKLNLLDVFYMHIPIHGGFLAVATSKD